jgi:hypothetical protein
MESQYADDVATPNTSRSRLKIGLFAAMLAAIGGLVAFNLLAPPEKVAGDPNRPSAPIDEKRVESVYKVGNTYDSVMKFSLDGRGINRDYGITVESTFHYEGVTRVLRTIEANDGKTLTVVLDFDRARNAHISTQVENVSLRDLGAGGELLLGVTDWIGTNGLGLPPEWTELTRSQTETMLNLDPTRDFMSRIASHESSKVLAYVDGLQGCKGKKCAFAT